FVIAGEELLSAPVDRAGGGSPLGIDLRDQVEVGVHEIPGRDEFFKILELLRFQPWLKPAWVVAKGVGEEDQRASEPFDVGAGHLMDVLLGAAKNQKAIANLR